MDIANDIILRQTQIQARETGSELKKPARQTNQANVIAETNKAIAEERKLAEAQAKKEKPDERISEFLNTGVQFEIEKGLGIVIAKLVDKDTGEVIRQIPAKEMIEIAKSIKGNTSGLFLSKEA
ncbi:MAG: flagellar protein FlaG [Dissulfurispiraceae bacterium]|jgi:flagellar protein FlaG|nr:flagellar protein FlaG [Dissulfurispiraceae bacterium]